MPRVRAAHTGGPPRPPLTQGSHRRAAPCSPDPGLSRHQSSGGDFPAQAENRGDVSEDPVSNRSERASLRVLCQPGEERLLGSPPLPSAPACPQGLRTAGEGQVSAEPCWPGLRMAWSWPLGRGGGQRGGPCASQAAGVARRGVRWAGGCRSQGWAHAAVLWTCGPGRPACLAAPSSLPYTAAWLRPQRGQWAPPQHCSQARPPLEAVGQACT